MQTILIVEDDDLTRLLATEYLSKFYKVISYPDVNTSLQDMSNYIKELDVAIVDIIYNDFRSGIDIWKELRDNGFPGPVVFFTGVSSDSKNYYHVLSCIEEDSDRLLHSYILNKPQTLDGLKCFIDNILNIKPDLKVINFEQIYKNGDSKWTSEKTI